MPLPTKDVCSAFPIICISLKLFEIFTDSQNIFQEFYFKNKRSTTKSILERKYTSGKAKLHNGIHFYTPIYVF